MKAKLVKCVFCGKSIPVSKASPIIRQVDGVGQKHWTCPDHHGVADEVRAQLLGGRLCSGDNPDNPDFVTIAQMADAGKLDGTKGK